MFPFIIIYQHVSSFQMRCKSIQNSNITKYFSSGVAQARRSFGRPLRGEGAGYSSFCGCSIVSGCPKGTGTFVEQPQWEIIGLRMGGCHAGLMGTDVVGNSRSRCRSLTLVGLCPNATPKTVNNPIVSEAFYIVATSEFPCFC